jgi:hypothetical protein
VGLLQWAGCWTKRLSAGGLHRKNEGGKKNCVGYAVWAAGAGNGGVGLRKGKDEKGWAGRKELAQEGLENFKSLSTYFQV